MGSPLARVIRALLRHSGHALLSMSERVPYWPGDLMERDGDWITYRVDATVWRLNTRQYVDSELFKHGVFEQNSTLWVRRLIKAGMHVMDIGANIGYYTVLLSQLVGPTGRVWAFEPSTRFRGRLLDHVRRNDCRNVVVLDFGLSDRNEILQLFESGDTATLHWCDERARPENQEPISLMPLDQYAKDADLRHLDFIKVDIDGHEPKFLEGADFTIRKFKPIMLLEFAQLYLPKVGSDAEKLARQIKALGYTLHSERTGRPFPTHTDFLIEAMNCAYSANILCVPNGRSEDLGLPYVE
jgi:FkbM family methyltransferase